MLQRSYTREQIQRLFHVIDWMVQLPEALEPAFQAAVVALQEDANVPYMNTFERIGHQKGLEEGIQRGREEGIQRGREEGINRGHREVALNLIRTTQLDDRTIAAVTQLELETVQALRARADDPDQHSDPQQER